MSDQTSVGSSDDVGTWLTKAELAHVRRISVASADRLIRRQGWRRQPGNDGRVRILVPPDWMHPRAGDPTDDEILDPTDEADNSAADREYKPFGPTDRKLLAGALAALKDAVSVLRDQVSDANCRADDAVALADRTMAQLADANRRADDAEAGRREAIALVEQTVALLTDERSRAAQAEAARQQDETLIANLEAELRTKDAEAGAMRDRLESAERDLAVAQREAQEAAEALRQAEEARKARGRWARLRVAWRGE